MARGEAMLSQEVNRYLAIRRATGFKLEDHERFLQLFACFASQRGESHVKSKTAIDWAAEARSPYQRGVRLRHVIRFARFIRAEDGRHEIPSGVFPCHYRRPTPYIYTREQVGRLVQEAARLGPEGSIRPHTFSTFFALLAVAALRVSEALALRVDDLSQDGLIIRATKFRKSRLVPLHETATRALAEYLDRRNRWACGDDHLFVSLRRRRLSYRVAIKTFHIVRLAAGILQSAGGRIPRIHDLRHTFAVRALEACPPARDRVARHMVALSTYLGHSHVEHTYWYLENTPELMTDISGACEALMHGGKP